MTRTHATYGPLGWCDNCDLWGRDGMSWDLERGEHPRPVVRVDVDYHRLGWVCFPCAAANPEMVAS